MSMPGKGRYTVAFRRRTRSSSSCSAARAMPPRLQSSLGSGVQVDPSGIVITNNHIIEGADEVKVATSDGREFESKILLKDQSLDPAVLKIEVERPVPGGEDRRFLMRSRSATWCWRSATCSVSARRRRAVSVSAPARTHVGGRISGFFIQTDAAINPGQFLAAGRSTCRGELGRHQHTTIYSALRRLDRHRLRHPLEYRARRTRFGAGGTMLSSSGPISARASMRSPPRSPRRWHGPPFRRAGRLWIASGGRPPRQASSPATLPTAMNGATIEQLLDAGYHLATQQIGATAKFTVSNQWRGADGRYRARTCTGGTPRSCRGQDRRRQPFVWRHRCRGLAAAGAKLRLRCGAKGAAIGQRWRRTRPRPASASCRDSRARTQQGDLTWNSVQKLAPEKTPSAVLPSTATARYCGSSCGFDSIQGKRAAATPTSHTPQPHQQVVTSAFHHGSASSAPCGNCSGATPTTTSPLWGG